MHRGTRKKSNPLNLTITREASDEAKLEIKICVSRIFDTVKPKEKKKGKKEKEDARSHSSKHIPVTGRTVQYAEARHRTPYGIWHLYDERDDKSMLRS
ncbi:hypothetical protein BOTCAL_0256g00100 [Botryotinia calthae]|uniref:Uncharacterized protein n=1 Tax=Botryotinia calthae TaxID=38488 RepID=A0A4Y8CWH0_9HELO|nr:hypothetical protein BOTCAL_0256g00100 [Botryotinia calthae]